MVAPGNQTDVKSKIKLMTFNPARYVLSRFRNADQLYRLYRHFPQPLKMALTKSYTAANRKTHKGGGIPARLTIFLTNQCNMKCAHCFIIKEKPNPLNDLTLEQYSKMFESIAGKVAQVLFTGGEPTIRKDFVEIATLANQIGQIPTISIFTNGLNTHEIVSSIKKILDSTTANITYQTSIDAIGNAHDENRRVRGAFRKALETLTEVVSLRKRYPGRIHRVISSTAISKSNMGDVQQIGEKIQALGVHPSFGFVRTPNDVGNVADPRLINFDYEPEEVKQDGTEKFSNNDFLSASDMEEMLQNLEENIWSQDHGRLHYAYNRLTMKTVLETKKTSASALSGECGMGYDDVVIMNNGDVSRCEMLRPVCNISEFDFDLGKTLSGSRWRNNLTETAGCWCTHDCGIGVSMMSDDRLLAQL